jgi:regulatory protein
MSENTLFRISLKKAMALCASREHCSGEIRNKLVAWDVGTTDIDKIIGLLEDQNFINEERYSQAFVKDKFNYNKWGKVKIAAHLRAKNIPGEIIKTTLDSIDTELYRKTLEDLISRHRGSVKAKNKYDLKAKLLRYGLSKGFESNLLYDILNDIEE